MALEAVATRSVGVTGGAADDVAAGGGAVEVHVAGDEHAGAVEAEAAGPIAHGVLGDAAGIVAVLAEIATVTAHAGGGIAANHKITQTPMAARTTAAVTVNLRR